MLVPFLLTSITLATPATTVLHPANWYAGWLLLLAAFLTGVPLGLAFHREHFWGGYASFRRRIVRLGHIALAALGMVNLLFAHSPLPAGRSAVTTLASVLFIAGGVTMPAVCFLAGWRRGFRHLFFIPVLCLIGAVALTLYGGWAAGL